MANNIIDSIQLSGTVYTLSAQTSGGGKAIEAGRGITVTTGETADTVSVSLPISAGTGTNSIAEGNNTTASGNYSHAEGESTSATSHSSHAEGNRTNANGGSSHAEGSLTIASGNYSHAEGIQTTASGSSSHAEGYHTTARGRYGSHAEGYYTSANNESEHASGRYNISNSATTTFGDSGNTLFSVGNGTADNARHNAFEIRQNGDIYISSGGTDIKLQDNLGGGSITVDSALDSGSTNPVENRAIYNKIDEVEEVTAAGLNALNDKITPTVELTQAQYDALVDKDPNTYYIITDAQAGDLTNYYTKSETNTLLGGKQDTLVSSSNIKTINNESILGSGNIDIQGGSDINVVQTTGTSTTDVMSQNAVTTQLNGKQDSSKLPTYIVSDVIFNTNQVAVNRTLKSNGGQTRSTNNVITINSQAIFNNSNLTNLSLVETSAITTSVTSSSTDAQVPSAKAVYDAIQEGGGGTVDQTIISGSTNAVAGGAVYNKIDEVEQVTAAGLNALNDNFGGLKLVSLSQAEYNALATKDSSTLYIIVN